nr:reverse transcriptase domain-containing protein [Tanacetum cinerariifolium]
MELAQIDTFYNGLNDNDQDSLNAVAGGNLLSKITREVLQIIENKSKLHYSRNKSNVSRMNTTSRENDSKSDYRIDKLADQISTLVDIFAKKVVTPAPVKAVEESCVTCGGAYAFCNCPNTDSNQPSVCATTGTYNQVAPQNRASNYMAPPGFALGEMKAITTRSGVAYEGPSIPIPKKVVERETEETTDKEQTNFQGSIAHIPYPSRLNDQKLREKATNQMENFADASLLMPKFASTIKSLLTNKDKFFELAKIPLNENCSAMLLKNLLEKLGDPGKFLIPCDFPGMDVCHALADLGASINLMPPSIWKKLSLPELTHTRITLELADRSITHPKGVAGDVFVKVGKFHFPTDFVVVDFEADPRVPLILGRSFLRTGRALINVYREEITFRVNDKAVTFNIIDVAREEYAQEIFGFSNNSSGGNPTLTFEPILSDSSHSLTLFEGSDFILEEIDAYLKDESISPKIDHADYDPEGDICLIEKLLNDDLENATKSDDRIDKLADQISTLVDIFAKKVVTPAPAKAVEESCVTCGRAHAFCNCPNTDSNQPSVCAATGTLLSNTIPNSKGEMKAITTRSGVAYEGPSIPIPKKTLPELNIPYPSRLNDQKLHEKATNKMEKFFQIFQDLHFDISFADASLLMPKFASTIKSLLTNKDKFFELAKILLNENCSAMHLKKLPEKLGDPGKFLIPCDFPGMDVCHALADLGASINLMPSSIWKKLFLPELTPTWITLELADRSITYPKGVAEDVFVKVGKFHFPTDFVVVDFEADPLVPLILGRSFLRTGRALIDVYREEITLRVNDKAVTFNIIDVAREEYAQEILEEIDAYLKDESISPEIDYADCDPEGDICLIEKLLNDDPFQLPSMDLKQGEEDYKPVVQSQRRVNPKIHEVIKKEVIKLLDAGMIYPISDSPWVSPIHCVPKKGGITIVENENNELIPTRIVYTDHSALKYLLSKQDDKPRLIRWVLLLQEFDIIIRDKKGMENLAADHLSRLENPHKDVFENKYINENFPLETLGKISSKSTPWFADFANFHVGNFIVKGVSSQQKKKFFKDVKHYFWDDPYLFEYVRIKSFEGVCMAKKLLISSKLVMKDLPGAIMVPVSPPRKYLMSVSFGLPFIEMLTI